MYNIGDTVKIKNEEHLKKEVIGKEGVIVAQHGRDVYSVSIDGVFYAFFENEIRKIKKN